MAARRTVLSSEDRVKVVSQHQKGETAIAIASFKSVGKTQVQQIIRDKETTLNRWEEGESGSRKLNRQSESTKNGIHCNRRCCVGVVS
jgi:hypothetical protein